LTEPANTMNKISVARPVRVGLVGTGIGRLHAAGIAKMPGTATLATVCGLDPQAVKDLAERYGSEKFTCQYKDLLLDSSLDVIDLCVPPDAHLPMALAAVQAGKHILVEKPLARNLAEADAIIQAAQSAGVTLMMGHNQRYYAHHAKAKELIDAGVIGKPFMIVATVHVHGQIDGFRRFLENAGGGTLIDSGVHRFDLIRWIMGEVATIYAQTDRMMQMQMEGEDCAVVTMRFRSGAIGNFSCSWSVKGPVPEETLQIFGNRGVILTEDHTRSLRLSTETPPAGLEDVREFVFPVDQAESIRRMLEAHFTNLQHDLPPPITGIDGRASLELAMACYQSAELGTPVELPLQL
jgi:predicted dehydrogenase